jgi:hypothetical protein
VNLRWVGRRESRVYYRDKLEGFAHRSLFSLIMSQLLRRAHDKVKLRGNEHEQIDAWSNRFVAPYNRGSADNNAHRDLIPLPPSRRTWGLLEYFGYWTISSLGVRL